MVCGGERLAPENCGSIWEARNEEVPGLPGGKGMDLADQRPARVPSGRRLLQAGKRPERRGEGRRRVNAAAPRRLDFSRRGRSAGELERGARRFDQKHPAPGAPALGPHLPEQRVTPDRSSGAGPPGREAAPGVERQRCGIGEILVPGDRRNGAGSRDGSLQSGRCSPAGSFPASM